MRYKIPDKKNALSIIEAAKKNMDFTLTLEINDSSAPTIIRNIYECFRMLGDAILSSKGIKSDNHILPIKEISSINIQSERPISAVENLRLLRHNINYYGYLPRKEEAKNSVSFAESCFYKAYTKIKHDLNNAVQSNPS